MSRIETDDVASRGHRLYVFGVVFASLFIVGFLLLAAIVSDLPRHTAPPTGPSQLAPNRGGSPTAIASLRSAEQEAAQARERLSAAEMALFRYLFDQLVEAQAPVAAEQTPSATQPLQTPPDANPQVLALEHELAEALQRRSTLLERMTPSHPEFQNLESTIADLQSRLDATRKTKIIEPATMPPQLAAAAAPDSLVPSKSAAMQRAQELMLAAGRAESAYKTAVAEVGHGWTAYHRQSSVSDSAGIMAIGPTVARPSPDISLPRPLIALGALILLSILLAFVAAGSARVVVPTFASAAEVAAQLSIPVLAQLNWSEGPISLPGGDAGDAGGDPRWLRRWVLMSEIVLALALGGMLVLAITDSAMLRQIADDPLSGFAQGIAKLRAMARV